MELATAIVNDFSEAHLEGVRQRIAAVGRALKASTLERDDVVDAIIPAMVAGQHCLLVGEPGTAKSQLLDGIVTATGARSFEYLLTRFTEPSEVFGSVNVKVLAETGRMKRNLDAGICTAEVAFLDEVFKANSAILNSTLKVMNERRFVDDGQVINVPLRFAVMASNEVPDADDASVAAFYDRTLVRLHVQPLADAVSFTAMMNGKTTPVPTGLASIADFDDAKEASRDLPLTADAMTVLHLLRAETRKAGVIVSDRRWSQIGRYLKAIAWLRGDADVGASLVGEVAPCLWSRVEQIPIVEDLVRKLAPSWEADARDIRRVIVEQIAAIEKAGKEPTQDMTLDALRPIARILKDAESDVASKVKPHSDFNAKQITDLIANARGHLSSVTAEAYRR